MAAKTTDEEYPLLAVSGLCQIADKELEAGKEKVPTFELNAYNGGELRVNGWNFPVVVDLQGCMDKNKSKIPTLHEHKELIGHTLKIEVSATSVNMTGVFSGINEQTKEVVATGLKGFPWQGSIGVRVLKAELIAPGKVVTANGRTFTGPVYVARAWKWKEVTLTKWGADDTTSARIAATQEKKMPPELLEILAAFGVDASTATEDQIAKAKIVLAKMSPDKGDDEGEGDKKKKGKPAREKAKGKALAASSNGSDDDDDDDDESLDVAATMRRQAAATQREIVAVTQQFSEFPELAAKAIEESWDEGRREAELRAARSERAVNQRPNSIHAFGISVKDGDLLHKEETIEAALALGCGVSYDFLTNPVKRMEKQGEQMIRQARVTSKPIDPKVIEAAEENFSGMGLQETVLWAARLHGGYNGMWGNGTKALRAAFSTVSLPTVFQNTLNRVLLDRIALMDLRWRRLVKVSSAKDFRTVDKFRVYGTGAWETVAQDGTLKQGTLAESTPYTNQLSTIGQHNVLTRQDFINDDLGALQQIGEMMSTYGGLAPEFGLFRKILANDGSWFNTTDKTLKTAVPLTSAAGIASLSAMHLEFKKKREQQTLKDKRGKGPAPVLAVSPRILLVPSSLEIVAWELMNTLSYNSGGGESAGTRVSDRNFFHAKYDVIDSPYLEDTAIHSNASATSYYLLADPNLIPAFDMMFLNGQQMPTIESADANFDTLGMQFRGYLDFGVAYAEKNGAIRGDAA